MAQPRTINEALDAIDTAPLHTAACDSVGAFMKEWMNGR